MNNTQISLVGAEALTDCPLRNKHLPARAVRLATGNTLLVRNLGTGRVEVETRNPDGETISTVVRSGDAARRLLLTLAAVARR